jgi:DNA ligase-1
MRALWNGHQLVSRLGNPIDAPDFFIAGFPADMCLDGELFAGRAQFQQTVSIARRQNGGELWRDLRFVVFDAPCNPGGFEERLAAVVQAEFLVLHPHEPCRSAEHLQEELKRVEALGGEGLMMRRKQSAYKFGRSQVLLKVKTFKDDEAIVYGHQPGKGRHSGRMGALQCKLKGGIEFKVGTGFSDQERGTPPPIGAVITFRYFELTNTGVPRFPTFVRIRPDVNASAFV